MKIQNFIYVDLKSVYRWLAHKDACTKAEAATLSARVTLSERLSPKRVRGSVTRVAGLRRVDACCSAAVAAESLLRFPVI